MRCLAGILITFLLTIPAMSVELFRYRGAGKSGRDRCRFYDDFLPLPDRRSGDSGISHDTGPILADLLFGRGERTNQEYVLRRLAA